MGLVSWSLPSQNSAVVSSSIMTTKFEVLFCSFNNSECLEGRLLKSTFSIEQCCGRCAHMISSVVTTNFVIRSFHLLSVNGYRVYLFIIPLKSPLPPRGITKEKRHALSPSVPRTCVTATNETYKTTLSWRL